MSEWTKTAPTEVKGEAADYYFYREAPDSHGAVVQVFDSGDAICVMFIGNDACERVDSGPWFGGEFSEWQGPLTPEPTP